MDRIEELVEVLNEKHFFHLLSRDIKHLLKHHNILKENRHIKTRYLHRYKLDCTFTCSIKQEDNNFNEKITILIKPDHSEQRCMRIIVQLGDKVYIKSENEDYNGWTSKKVFKKEYKELRKDMIDFFDEELKKVI